MPTGHNPNPNLQVRLLACFFARACPFNDCGFCCGVGQILTYLVSIDATWSKSSPEPTTPIKTSQPPLKRSRSSISTMDPLPSIPRLSGDIILEVFTHRSLRFLGAPINDDSEFGDNDRLALLGEKSFEIAVTDALFRKRPMLKADEIEASGLIFHCRQGALTVGIQSQREEWASPTAIENWVTGYKLRDKLRFSRDAVESIRDFQVCAVHSLYTTIRLSTILCRRLVICFSRTWALFMRSTV